jgi:predicted DNA-binding transcriptional regulator AlpA
MDSEKLYYTTTEIAHTYGLSASYLKNLRHLGQGPPYLKIGKTVLYRRDEFDEWFNRTAVEVSPQGG